MRVDTSLSACELARFTTSRSDASASSSSRPSFRRLVFSRQFICILVWARCRKDESDDGRV